MEREGRWFPLTEQDMEVWKRGYDIHEKYYGCPKSSDEWLQLAEDCRRMYADYPGELSLRMSIMLMDYFDTEHRKKHKKVS